MRILMLTILMFLFHQLASAQESIAYNIDINVDNYDQDTLLIAFYYGERQLVKDTLLKKDDGIFNFSGTEPLRSGMYMILTKPDNKFIQFLMPEDDQSFSVFMDTQKLSSVQFKGSVVNKNLYQYLDFLSEARYVLDSLQLKRSNAVSSALDTTTIDLEISNLNQDVQSYPSRMSSEKTDKLLTAVMMSNKELKIPEFVGTEKEVKQKRYAYYKDHYFDHTDPADPNNLYMPFLHSKIVNYFNNVIVQNPDSIIVELNAFFDKLENTPDTYKYYLSYFLNTYGNSRVIGMDAIYVHLIDQYYAQGKASWVSEDILRKIVSRANRIRPTLIGKTGSDLELYREDGSTVRLSDLDYEYLVLMFWAPNCGHCTKAMPFAIEFNKKYKDNGVKLVGICTKGGEKYPACWKGVKEKNMDSFLNLGDQYQKSRFKVKYNVDKTPKIFILDKNREILIKDIGAQQLDKVMNALMTQNESSKLDK